MSADDDRHFTRTELLDWPPDGQRQTAAWDRLRRICLDLGLRVPTRAEIQSMDHDLSELYLDFQQQLNLFDEEWAGVVICTRVADGLGIL